MKLGPVVLSLVAVISSGCAQSYLKGAVLVRKDLSKNSLADFRVENCIVTSTGEHQDFPKGITHHLINYEGRVAFYEHEKAASSVITNSWEAPDGTHYFQWVMANGYEFIVPRSGNGRRLVRRGGTYRDADGTGRPNDKPPTATCDLIRIR